MAFKNAVLPPDSLILVTGANGYIASHCVDKALQAGYRVRGTVRDVAKNQWLNTLFEKYGSDRFELVAVDDFAAENAFDDALKGVAGILHVAAPVNPSLDPNETIPLVIKGNLSILKSAAKEPSIKRFVLTTSSVAAAFPKPNVEFVIDENSWNEQAVEDAWAPPPYEGMKRGFAIYAATKVQGEQAMWKWVEENKPEFVVNSVLPNANFGTILDHKNQGFPSTANWVAWLWKGERTDTLKFWDPQYFIDVQDCALLHLAALISPDVKNERVFAFAEPYNWNDILAVYRELCPDRKFMDDFEDLPRDVSIIKRKGRAEELLREAGRPGFTGLKESLKDFIESFS